MRKILGFLGLFFAGITIASAQGTLGEKNLQLNGGVGFSSQGIPVYVGLDYGISNDFTIGGEVSFRSYKTDLFGSYIRHTGFGFSGNGNYHFNRILNIPREFDFYAGASLGFYYWNSKWDGFDRGRSIDTNSPLYFGLQLGGRYFFDNNWGVNLELGGGSTVGAKIGVTYKL